MKGLEECLQQSNFQPWGSNGAKRQLFVTIRVCVWEGRNAGGPFRTPRSPPEGLFLYFAYPAIDPLIHVLLHAYLPIRSRFETTRRSRQANPLQRRFSLGFLCLCRIGKELQIFHIVSCFYGRIKLVCNFESLTLNIVIIKNIIPLSTFSIKSRFWNRNVIFALHTCIFVMQLRMHLCDWLYTRKALKSYSGNHVITYLFTYLRIFWVYEE